MKCEDRCEGGGPSPTAFFSILFLVTALLIWMGYDTNRSMEEAALRVKAAVPQAVPNTDYTISVPTDGREYVALVYVGGELICVEQPDEHGITVQALEGSLRCVKFTSYKGATYNFLCNQDSFMVEYRPDEGELCKTFVPVGAELELEGRVP